MTIRSVSVAVAAALALGAPVALGLGLGDMRAASALNERFAAEIELISPTAEEIASLQAQLGSRELFERYGLDRPPLLDGFQFKVDVRPDGTAVLKVSSQQPVSEPFLTLLVEVNWAKGRVLREYTVLLDPPVFAPRESAPAAPPRAATTTTQPAPAARQEPAAAPAAPAPSAEPSGSPYAGQTYRVQPGETLYSIAGRLSTGGRAGANRMALALFEQNPQAFGGNVNRLRSGAILRVPEEADLAVIEANEAALRLRDQNRAWNANAGDSTEQLRLVAPSQEATTEDSPTQDVLEPAAEQSQDPTAPVSLEQRAEQLNREIDEARRLLDLKSAELARLQSTIAEQQAAAAAAAEAPSDTQAPEEAGAAEPAEVTAQEPAPSAEAPPVAAESASAAAEDQAGQSWIEQLAAYWMYLLAAAVAAVLGGLLYGYRRRRRDEDLYDSAEDFQVPSDLEERIAAAREIEDGSSGMLLGSSEPVTPPAADPVEAAEASSEPAAPLATPRRKTDPLAEADFQMAYGLYDRAAEIMTRALTAEPGRRDFELKLLEIFFVSGNRGKFLEAASHLSGVRSEIDPADWDRVLIMGRQLAPDHPLFSGSQTETASVDVELEGDGTDVLDVELSGPDEGGTGVDLDFGSGLEEESLDLDFNVADRQSAPTEQLPALDEDLDETRIQRAPSADVTAELPLSDLGIDPAELDALNAMGTQELPMLDEAEALQTGLPDFDSTMEIPSSKADWETSLGDEPAEIDLSAEEGNEAIEMDFGLLDDSLAQVAGASAEEGAEIDLLAEGGDEEAPLTFDDLPKPEGLEPLTLSEVGTKLDLARAYVDMGDPDGARSILAEVLKEGSVSQKEEAERLLRSLPGDA
ncbi:MAG: FimV/HubP family polar landmark protein [Steroidobacteraceae bacterium]